MTDWLSATWEANWRSFQYFNLYRLILAALSLLAVVFPHPWADPFHIAATPGLLWFGIAYLLLLVLGLLFSLRGQQRFNLQLSLQVLADVLAVSVFMLAAGGVASGIGVLLLVALAAASLVGRGRLVLLYAAEATIVVLGMQIYGVLQYNFDLGSIVQAGFLSAGFFATAILARLLGQRLMFNEDLARRRGIALDNQQGISQRVIERMQDGVLVVSREGVINRHNPVAGEMLGLATGDLDNLPVCSGELAAMLRRWRAGERLPSLEFAGVNGRSIRARFESTASSDGEALVFLDDVGRIQEAAQQLKLASLGRLTANIAHEIRNPLAAISHAGELLREERQGEIQERLLCILHDNVARLDRIVQDVLEIGRRDGAQPELIDLPDFCQQFVESYGAAEAVPQGLIGLTLPAEARLWFDRAHLHQVLWNLLRNAIRHSQQARGSVQLRIERVAGRVELHVTDDGPGIPLALKAQIFEPFFTTHAQGTGLGLYIARALCEANAATLELQPSVSGGYFIVQGRGDV
jgi:two-component system sensor histidine kinase PilS (NtrC family)